MGMRELLILGGIAPAPISELFTPLVGGREEEREHPALGFPKNVEHDFSLELG
jgi:hypothetical protein